MKNAITINYSHRLRSITIPELDTGCADFKITSGRSDFFSSPEGESWGGGGGFGLVAVRAPSLLCIPVVVHLFPEAGVTGKLAASTAWIARPDE